MIASLNRGSVASACDRCGTRVGNAFDSCTLERAISKGRSFYYLREIKEYTCEASTPRCKIANAISAVIAQAMVRESVGPATKV